MTPNPTAHRSPAKHMKRLAAFLVALLWLWSAGFVAATAQSMTVGLLVFAAYPLALAVAPSLRRRAVVSVFGALAGVALALFFARRPSNDRGWEDDQAVLPAVEFIFITPLPLLSPSLALQPEMEFPWSQQSINVEEEVPS